MNIRWLLLPAALLCCQVANAAPAEPAASPPTDQAELPQVDVEARRAKLKAMELQLHALEDQFFAQYNRFNTQRAFKVKCGWEMSQHFRVHKCRPTFVEWAEHDGLSFVQLGSTGFPYYRETSVVPLRVQMYQKNLVATVEKHPELLEVLKERAELGKRYLELRKDLLEEKAVVFE